MGYRKIVIRQSAAEAIAEISWYLESEGLLATAERFVDDAYDFIEKIGDTRRRECIEPERNALGYKCISYKKKYTITFVELDTEIIICEFILSKRIYW